MTPTPQTGKAGYSESPGALSLQTKTGRESEKHPQFPHMGLLPLITPVAEQSRDGVSRHREGCAVKQSLLVRSGEHNPLHTQDTCPGFLPHQCVGCGTPLLLLAPTAVASTQACSHMHTNICTCAHTSEGQHVAGDPGSGKLQYCWGFLQQQEVEGHTRGSATQTRAKTFIQGQEALTGLEISEVSEMCLLA